MGKKSRRFRGESLYAANEALIHSEWFLTLSPTMRSRRASMAPQIIPNCIHFNGLDSERSESINP